MQKYGACTTIIAGKQCNGVELLPLCDEVQHVQDLRRKISDEHAENYSQILPQRGFYRIVSNEKRDKILVFYNQGMRHNDKVVVTENPDIIGRANENHRYTRLIDRLQGHICESAEPKQRILKSIMIRKLKDLSGKAEWERQMITRKRKTIALCHSCHVKLHNGKLD